MSIHINKLLQEVGPLVIQWRRYIHQHPELANQEVHTIAYIREQLESFGAGQFKLNSYTPTSLVAELTGASPGDTYALRADIDALPILEAVDEPWKSTNNGVMHACGHDAHTACVLGAAYVFSKLRSSMNGSIRFIFQHAEEVPPGGAQELVKAGVMKGVKMVFGLHCMPLLPTGVIGVKNGVITASSDRFDITMHGKGGHASMPELCIDPIIMAGQVIAGAQTIVSRRISPLNAPVISITAVNAGESFNVIPDTAVLRGTVRTHHKKTQELVPQYLEKVCAGVAAQYGGTYDFKWTVGYKMTINDNAATDLVRNVVRTYLSPQQLVEVPDPTYGGEDFSSYSELVPGSFYVLGTGNPKINANAILHNAKFKLDEDALAIGTKVHVHLLADQLLK